MGCKSWGQGVRVREWNRLRVGVRVVNARPEPKPNPSPTLPLPLAWKSCSRKVPSMHTTVAS